MQELRIPNEIYSRISGYYRPVEQWNKAKKEEKSERRNMKFDLNIVRPTKKTVTEEELIKVLLESADEKISSVPERMLSETELLQLLKPQVRIVQ